MVYASNTLETTNPRTRQHPQFHIKKYAMSIS
jgi:hypothetical protein